MTRTVFHSLGAALALVVAVACSNDMPAGPDLRPALERVSLSQTPDLGSCTQLQPQEEVELVTRLFAKGVQIYGWNGTSWAPVGPSAVLYADATLQGVVGSHYGGPTWESNSGSKVIGTVQQRCTPDPTAIQWLLLGAVSSGSGIFERVKYIQRVNTVGGLAPAAPGSFVGEQRSTPYSTEYYFYRAK